MIESLGVAPDLRNGFMIHGTDQDNSWQTDIEAALYRADSDSVRRRAFLAADCRAEHVGPKRIFGKRLSEVAAIDTWNGRFMLRAGAGLYPALRWRTDADDRLHCGPGPAGSVHCDDVAVRILSFDAVLDELAAPPTGRNNRFFVRFSWRTGEFAYDLYAPCRYLNFRNFNRSSGLRYLQPITGYVLLEEDERFFIGYAAAYIEEGRVLRTELIARRRASYFALKQGIGGPLSLAATRLLDGVFGGFFSTDEFVAPKPIDAECEFYRYGEAM